MADDFIRFAFTGGVFSRGLIGRSDIEKYDLGLAAGENWFIHYQGGASTRPGTFFLDYIQDDDLDVRLAEFKFSTRIADVYLMIWSKDRLRFMQSGAYVLETVQGINSITGANLFHVPAHGYVDGDWVKLTGITGQGTYEITDAAPGTFKLLNPDGTAFTFVDVYDPAMQVARIYTVASPFATTDLSELVFSQTRNEVTITHLDYPPHRLTRLAATNWTLAAINFDGNTSAPGALTLTPETAGTSGVVYGVTAVNTAGAESYISDFTLTELTNNFTTTEGSMEITWPLLTGAQFYNVYRSIVYPIGAQTTLAQELGFIGRTKAPRFVDANIVPDFTCLLYTSPSPRDA